MAYCSPADLYEFGMQPGALPNPARLIYKVAASTNVFTLDAHGLYDGSPVSFRADSVDGDLPDPIVDGETYYALRLGDSTFSVAATIGGPAIDLTTNGVRVLVITPVPVDAAIAWASEIIDDNLPAHILPLPEPYPEIVRMTAAELAMGKLMSYSGAAPETLSKAVDAAQKRLERWAKGVPLRKAPLETRANRSASAGAAYVDCRGWRDRCRL